VFGASLIFLTSPVTSQWPLHSLATHSHHVLVFPSLPVFRSSSRVVLEMVLSLLDVDCNPAVLASSPTVLAAFSSPKLVKHPHLSLVHHADPPLTLHDPLFCSLRLSDRGRVAVFDGLVGSPL